MLRSTWYVLLYHDVSWEEPPHLRGIGDMVVPPDLFREHLDTLDAHGSLVSPGEAIRRLECGSVDGPLFSLWFDDGYAGVRRYALPWLADRGLTAAVSVCSRFAAREEMYWRAELGWLAGTDGMRFVRSRLRRLGIDPGTSVRDTVMDRFSPAVRAAIGRCYERYTPGPCREDGFRLFDTIDGLRRLADAGWWMTNHSAAHWPVGESPAIDSLAAQFRECAASCANLGLPLTDDWVLPFDRRRDASLDARFDAACPGGRLVLVGNRATGADDLARRRIHRIVAPPIRGAALIERLGKA